MVSASNVGVTGPSTLFSMATHAKSASPLRTAASAAPGLSTGTVSTASAPAGSISPRRAMASRAASVNVPAGPR